MIDRIEQAMRAVPRIDAVKQDGSVDTARDPDYAEMAKVAAAELSSGTADAVNSLLAQNAALLKEIEDLKAENAKLTTPPPVAVPAQPNEPEAAPAA